jgi:hypothetical protein
MHDAGAVGGGDGVGDLERELERLAQGQAALRDHAVERPALDVLHHDELEVAVGSEVVHGHDVGMIERRGGPRLAHEARAPRRVVGGQRRQQLQRDDAAEAGVARLVDHAHPALAELLQHLVVEQLPTDDRVGATHEVTRASSNTRSAGASRRP